MWGGMELYQIFAACFLSHAILLDHFFSWIEEKMLQLVSVCVFLGGGILPSIQAVSKLYVVLSRNYHKLHHLCMARMVLSMDLSYLPMWHVSFYYSLCPVFFDRS